MCNERPETTGAYCLRALKQLGMHFGLPSKNRPEPRRPEFPQRH
jgi:hypothetical protein